MNFIATLIIIGMASHWAAVDSLPLRFQILPGRADNIGQFLVRSPLETTTGVTHAARGFISLDPSGQNDSSGGLIQVPANSFTTGSGWRDRLMQDKYLEVDSYPDITFAIQSIHIDSALLPNHRTAANVTGRYTLHGVTRDVRPETFLTYIVSDTAHVLRIEATFEEKLTDYDIKVPSILFFKGANYQKVSVDITAFALPDSAK